MLPIVMLANNVRTAEELAIEFPGRIGVLLTPGAKRISNEVPFVLDNGRFSARKGGHWSAKSFRKLLELAAESERSPRWIVVPDVVGDGKATLLEWNRWTERLEPFGWSLALAVQDGMIPDDVRALDRLPDVVFVGGTTKWKWLRARDWCSGFDRVHIGRVGTVAGLWRAQRVGAESSDSNVWRPVGRHLIELRKYLEESNAGSSKGETRKGFGFIK